MSTTPPPETPVHAQSANELTKKIVFEDTTSEFTFSSKTGSDTLRIIHFNDVYNIESSSIEPKAGAARFLTAVNLVQKEMPCLVFFSGDAFSPSVISLVTKGEQMIPILNSLNINAACIGNHDFDFGVECLEGLIERSNFPWCLSNFLDVKTKRPMANAHLKRVIEFNGIKIGIMGLVEKEWIDTLNMIEPHEIIYESFIDVGRNLASELKNQDKCDYIIALTHMRVPNDKLLAEEIDDIDLVLGGHDHHYHVEPVNNKWIFKSGTDFKDFSLIKIAHRNDVSKLKVRSIERFIVDSKVEEDAEMKKICEEFLFMGEKGLDVVLGTINSDLDGRFVTVRSMESNIGSYICDLIMLSVKADCVIINSGTLRSDCITPAGDFTVGDLKKIIPFPDQIIVLLCDGKTVHEALENSVSQYPKLEGRFPQVAGIQFKFDPSKPPGERINLDNIRIHNEPLDYNQNYKLACKGYMKDGRDGFQMLTKCPVLIDEEDGPLLFSIVENHFKRFQKKQSLNNNNNNNKSHNTPDINSNTATFCNQNNFDDLATSDTNLAQQHKYHLDEDIQEVTDKLAKLNEIDLRRKSLQKSQSENSFLVNSSAASKYLKKLYEIEKHLMKFEPVCDGRIYI